MDFTIKPTVSSMEIVPVLNSPEFVAIKNIISSIWDKIIGNKKKYSINISTLDEKLTVGILFGRKKKYFSDKNPEVIVNQLSRYLQAF